MPNQYPDISEPVECSVKVGQYLDYEILKFLKFFTNLQWTTNNLMIEVPMTNIRTHFQLWLGGHSSLPPAKLVG